MAVMVDFQKVREDRQEVEYIFGFPTMDRRMVIQKDPPAGRPLDGEEDLLYRKAYVKIIRTQLGEGTWPEVGGYAA